MVVSQLLPDVDQARILRNLLLEYIGRPSTNEKDRDSAYEMMAKLAKDIHIHNQRHH